MLSTEAILENIVRLVNLFDDAAQPAIADLPFLELAKWVVFSEPGQRA